MLHAYSVPKVCAADITSGRSVGKYTAGLDRGLLPQDKKSSRPETFLPGKAIDRDCEMLALPASLLLFFSRNGFLVGRTQAVRV